MVKSSRLLEYISMHKFWPWYLPSYYFSWMIQWLTKFPFLNIPFFKIEGSRVMEILHIGVCYCETAEMKRLFSLIDIIRISIKKYNEIEIKNHYQYSRQFISNLTYLLYSHIRNEFGRFQLKTIFIYNHEPIVFPKPNHSLWIYFWR